MSGQEARTVDLFLFMGQSNMAGRGRADDAPALTPGAGYEYRAVTSPEALCPLSEPFGQDENRPGGIDDGDLKTGSMVTALVNAYYARTGVPVVGVSASKGGSRIAQWQPGGAFLTDALARLRAADAYLAANGYAVRHRYALWCQGESDGDDGKTAAAYRADFERMLCALRERGIERCFMVGIGHYNGGEGIDYAEIRAAQADIANTNDAVTMVSTAFEGMKARGLMKDAFHYFQQAYNEVGAEAGDHAALYVNALESAAEAGHETRR